MYEELVKRLMYCRNNAAIITDEELVEIADEAADAIEELMRRCEQFQYMPLPRWIPVTEELPKTRESLLGKKSSKVLVAFRFNDGTQGTDTAHTLNGEWVFEDHITVVERTVTHWMPLPQPPKEET